jgi:hypothetical protein
VIVVVVLVVLLVARELAAVAGPQFQPLARNLTVGIAPLLVVFVMIAANRILLLLGPPPVFPLSEDVRGRDATPTTQAEPRTEPESSEVSVAGAQARQPLDLLLDEAFDGRRPGWPDDPQGRAWFADGVYYLAAREPGQFVALGAPAPEVLRDVVVSARFRKVAGPPGGGYGLILRDQGPGPRDGRNQGGRYHVLEVSDSGQLGIWRRQEDHWEDLVPWIPSDAVHRGTEPNELVARASGVRLTLMVNGAEVARAIDSAPAAGRVGVFVGGDLNQVALEHLVVQAGE